MQTAMPAAITAVRSLASNPRVAEQAAISFVGSTPGLLPKGPSFNLASDAVNGISPIAMA